jgi:peptidoglycan biosynthesis protein MviN/MurJ (putative lipid II flippase)
MFQLAVNVPHVFNSRYLKLVNLQGYTKNAEGMTRQIAMRYFKHSASHIHIVITKIQSRSGMSSESYIQPYRRIYYIPKWSDPFPHLTQVGATCTGLPFFRLELIHECTKP